MRVVKSFGPLSSPMLAPGVAVFEGSCGRERGHGHVASRVEARVKLVVRLDVRGRVGLRWPTRMLLWRALVTAAAKVASPS